MDWDIFSIGTPGAPLRFHVDSSGEEADDGVYDVEYTPNSSPQRQQRQMLSRGAGGSARTRGARRSRGAQSARSSAASAADSPAARRATANAATGSRRGRGTGRRSSRPTANGSDVVVLAETGEPGRRGRVFAGNAAENEVVPMLGLPRIDSPDQGPSSKRPNYRESETDACCPICYEEYHNTGAHRVVCLKCGHLFGKTCIERWIVTERNQNCPTCKVKAVVKDIRPIFGNFGKGESSGEVTQLKLQLKSVAKEKEELVVSLARAEENLRKTTAELNTVRKALETYVDLNTEKVLEFKLTLKKQNGSTQLANDSTVRVVCAPNGQGFVVCGCSLVAQTGKKFGVAKFSLVSGCANKFPLHEKIVRSLDVNPANNRQVVSTSDDNYLIISDVTRAPGSAALFSYRLHSAGWACCWISETQVVVGLRNGRVLRYTVGVDESEDLTDGVGDKPIIALAYDANHRVLFICNSTSVKAHRVGTHDPTKRLITVVENVSMSSFCYERQSNCFLLTVVPTPSTPVILKLYKVDFLALGQSGKENSPGKMIGEYRTSSRRLSRNTVNIIWPAPTGHLLCAFFHDDRKWTTILNWDKPADRQPDDKPLVLYTLKHNKEDVVHYAQASCEAPVSPVSPSGMQNILYMVSPSQLFYYYLVYE